VSCLLSCALISALLAPPAIPAPAATPSVQPPLYSEPNADDDLEIVVTARGKTYLEARARLEANPAIAAPRVAVRLRRVPAPSAAEERRLLALLAGMARPEDLEMFATQLRRDVAASHKLAPSERDELRAAAPWRTVLREQGAGALAVLTALVAERDLSIELRALLVADMVSVTPPDRLTELIALVGAGAPELRQGLRQALAQRARASAEDRVALLRAVDAAIERSEPSRTAALINLRAGLGDGVDVEFTATLIRMAGDEAAAFVVRVAALRALLTRAADPAVQQSLLALAGRHLEKAQREQQASEILGVLALQGLPPDAASSVVERHALLSAPAPRVASAAYASAALPADGAWLESSQTHPWPEVRVAALSRVLGPCPAPVIKKLAQITDATGRRSESEARVAREAIAGLGRCGGDPARAVMTRLVRAEDQDGDRRAEAARQLVKHHAGAGADVVASALARTGEPGLSIRFVRALQRSEAPASASVREALCGATEAVETAAAARQAITALFPGEDVPCGQRAAPERPDPMKPRVYVQ